MDYPNDHPCTIVHMNGTRLVRYTHELYVRACLEKTVIDDMTDHYAKAKFYKPKT